VFFMGVDVLVEVLTGLFRNVDFAVKSLRLLARKLTFCIVEVLWGCL
jgi:hypothetical protein